MSADVLEVQALAVREQTEYGSGSEDQRFRKEVVVSNCTTTRKEEGVGIVHGDAREAGRRELAEGAFLDQL
jgi:hypothetical protein